MRFTVITLLSLGLVGVCAERASAATATATLAVSATVSKTCVVSNGTLAFGTYSPVSATPTDNSATFTLTCTKNTAATIGLNSGSNASGSTRRMSDGGTTPNYLTYELYQDVSRSTVWGNASGSWLNNTSASNAAQTLTVYGRIAALQDVPSTTTYTDSVTITVTF